MHINTYKTSCVQLELINPKNEALHFGSGNFGIGSCLYRNCCSKFLSKRIRQKITQIFLQSQSTSRATTKGPTLIKIGKKFVFIYQKYFGVMTQPSKVINQFRAPEKLILWLFKNKWNVELVCRFCTTWFFIFFFSTGSTHSRTTIKRQTTTRKNSSGSTRTPTTKYQSLSIWDNPNFDQGLFTREIKFPVWVTWRKFFIQVNLFVLRLFIINFNYCEL